MRVAGETSKFQNWPYFNNSNCRQMAEILPIRRKTQINQSFRINQVFFNKNMYEKGFHLISDLLDEDGEFIKFDHT